MTSKLDIETLEEVQRRVKHKLETKKSAIHYSKRAEGYEEAMLAVLSIIHELKGKAEGQRKGADGSCM